MWVQRVAVWVHRKRVFECAKERVRERFVYREIERERADRGEEI